MTISFYDLVMSSKQRHPLASQAGLLCFCFLDLLLEELCLLLLDSELLASLSSNSKLSDSEPPASRPCLASLILVALRLERLSSLSRTTLLARPLLVVARLLLVVLQLKLVVL